MPVNVDPFDARLDDEMERNRLRRVFSQGLALEVGYVLPLQPVPLAKASGSVTHWQTGRWFVRDERMYLMPGDSPMGWRLPLDSLPWAAPGDRQHMIEQDPFAQRTALAPSLSTVTLQPRTAAARAAKSAQATASVNTNSGPASLVGTVPAGKFQSDANVVRTALCVEVRDPRRANGPQADAAALKTGDLQGVLYVFMPPIEDVQDYLNLVAAVEATAKQLQMPIVLEGYPPPRDPRLKLLQVTPDPGVIEVNIHPAHNWGELVAHTEFLYQAAFETRLSAEKFMTDGRHTGTGGGNHVVMGLSLIHI